MNTSSAGSPTLGDTSCDGFIIQLGPNICNCAVGLNTAQLQIFLGARAPLELAQGKKINRTKKF